MKSFTYEPIGGESINHAAQEMVDLANNTKSPVEASFNDILINASPGDDPANIVAYYNAESERRYQEWVNSDEYKQQAEKARIAQENRNNLLRGALTAAPTKMTILEERCDEWKHFVETNNQDGYSKSVIDFAQRWARLMETRISRGDAVKDCAKDTATIADNEGITGFMYGVAVSVLARFWKYGEELRCWHNLDTQIGTEGEQANKTGGTLNPALLSIGPKV